MERKISHPDLLELKRWNTPTIYNGWEQITKHDFTREGFNLEPANDYNPQMGPMVGYAVTVVIEPGNRQHTLSNPDSKKQYREYVASVEGPKIVIVQDLDKPMLYGSFWGEVNGNIHRAIGCVGTITDGGIRDIDEMNNAGFKALARGVCVGHAKLWTLGPNSPPRHCDLWRVRCGVHPRRGRAAGGARWSQSGRVGCHVRCLCKSRSRGADDAG